MRVYDGGVVQEREGVKNGRGIIFTDVTGAAISIDGVAKGTTPVTIPSLAIGSHTLTATLAGYQSLTQPVTVTAGTTTVPLNLVPATGSLYVTSVPAGAVLPLFL